MSTGPSSTPPTLYFAAVPIAHAYVLAQHPSPLRTLLWRFSTGLWTRPTTHYAIRPPTWSSLCVEPFETFSPLPVRTFLLATRLPTVNKTTFLADRCQHASSKAAAHPPSVRLGPRAPQIMQHLQGAIIPAVARAAKDIFPPDVQATAKAAISTTLSASFTASTTPIPTATMAAATVTATGSPHDRPEGSGECRLVGSFAVFVQLALGGLALLVLVYKRWRERPQRPVKIWFFDVSKQVFGSVLVHGANIFMSMLTSGRLSIKVDPPAAARRWLMARGHGVDGDKYMPNPCSFYLLNLAIDTTLGIPILILLVRLTTMLVSRTPLGKPSESIQSGFYGNPPKWQWWLKQSIIYFCGLFGMKICVLIIFLVIPWISHVGDWALGWTEGNEKLQIVFVMMLFPLIMNAMQYYIIDSFIKERTHDEAGDAVAGRPRLGSQEGSYDRLSESGDDDHEEELADRGSSLGEGNRTKGGIKATSRDREYDPETDGDDERTVIGSASTAGNQQSQALLSKGLLPHE
ncbi:hypothetical protein PpBr36_01096 [Pyricularia pennisetigena]|uniref:hypothetical protein n=1 Tax=Pyricularia pennisetigena TaxID=1578925 RepID=UPI00114EF34C|nr:hypothetical protein PpBr36_01096 [Pyricularia pennisetigena]TLS28089.1 hypothetical protein PpBr36_01096 [Pyricularia pennisetigena]